MIVLAANETSKDVASGARELADPYVGPELGLRGEELIDALGVMGSTDAGVVDNCLTDPELDPGIDWRVEDDRIEDANSEIV